MSLEVEVLNGGGTAAGTAILTTRLRADLGLSLGNKAYDGQGSQGELTFDDDDGEYGNEEALPGGLTMLSVAAHNPITVVETATTPDTYLLNGHVGEKAIGRGEKHQDRSRQVRLTLEDSNSHLRGITLTSDQARSSESDVTRVTWVLTTFLQGSPRLRTNLASRIVNSDTVTMPAKTYEAGTPIIDILRDCATAAGKVFFVYNEGDGTLSLYYAVNTNASLRAGLRISDDDDDIDYGVGIDPGGAVSIAGTATSSPPSGADGTGKYEFGNVAADSSQAILVSISSNSRDVTYVRWYPTPSSPLDIGGDTYQSFTNIGDPGSGVPHIETWLLQAPADGAAGTILIQHSTAADKEIYSYLVLDNAASAPYTVFTNTGTGTAVSTSTSAASGDLIIDTMGWWEDVGTPSVSTAGGSQNVEAGNLWFGNPGVNDGELIVSSLTASGSDSMSWTTGASVDWEHIVVVFGSGAEFATFPPIWVNNTASQEKGLGLLSGGVLRHGGGAIFSNDSAIVDQYNYWVEPINDIQAVDAADGTARLAKILALRNTEDRTYTVAVQLHRTQVDLVHAGDLIDIKARAIPDADDQFRTRRVANLEWQWIGPEHYYAVMELDRPLIGVGNPGSSGASKAEVSAAQKTEAAVTAHESASDPHSGYVREADANWVDLTDGGATTLHSHSGASGLVIEEADGSPTGTFDTLKVPNGRLTDNGDGSASLDLAASTHAHGSPAAGFHGVLVQRTTDFTTIDDNDNNPDFDTEIYDTDGLWSAGAPERITIPASWNGLHAVFHVHGGFATGTDGFAEFKLYRNIAAGSIGLTNDDKLVGVAQHFPSSSYNTFIELVTPPIQVATGDFFVLAIKSPNTDSAIEYHDISITMGAYLVEPGEGAQGDPGQGVPTGGTAGQVLTKDSGTDFDTSWQTPAEGGAHILLADGRSTPFTFNDLLQMEDGSDFMWSD